MRKVVSSVFALLLFPLAARSDKESVDISFDMTGPAFGVLESSHFSVTLHKDFQTIGMVNSFLAADKIDPKSRSQDKIKKSNIERKVTPYEGDFFKWAENASSIDFGGVSLRPAIARVSYGSDFYNRKLSVKFVDSSGFPLIYKGQDRGVLVDYYSDDFKRKMIGKVDLFCGDRVRPFNNGSCAVSGVAANGYPSYTVSSAGTMSFAFYLISLSRDEDGSLPSGVYSSDLHALFELGS